MGRVIRVNFKNKSGYELGEVVRLGKRPKGQICYIYLISEEDIHIATESGEYKTIDRHSICKVHKSEIAYFLDKTEYTPSGIYDYVYEYYKELK